MTASVGDALAHRFADRDKTEDRFERLLEEFREQQEEQDFRRQAYRREDTGSWERNERGLDATL